MWRNMGIYLFYWGFFFYHFGEIRKDVGGALGAFVVFSAQGSLELFQHPER